MGKKMPSHHSFLNTIKILTYWKEIVNKKKEIQ